MKQQYFVAVILAAIAGVGSVGCAARAGAYAGSEPPVVYSRPPTLVYLDSNVWVVRDSDYPAYYSDGYYWVYRDGVWYRSHTYDGDWTQVDSGGVPSVIVHRDHRTYVHYQGPPAAETRPAPHTPATPSMTPASRYDAPPPPPRATPVPPPHRTPPGHDRRAAPPPPQRAAPPPPPQRAAPPAPKQRAAPPAPKQRAAPPAPKQQQPPGWERRATPPAPKQLPPERSDDKNKNKNNPGKGRPR